MTSVAAQLAELFARPIAHRGLHACGGAAGSGLGLVENTIAAAVAAIAGGYGIECDVQLSGDGEAFVFHDDDLERLTGESGRFGGCAAAEIAALTLGDGSPIPTLAAFLAAIGGRTPLVIEVKSDGDMRLADAVLAQVRDYAGMVAIESFDPAVVARCRDALCPIGLVGPGSEPTDPAALSRCDFLSWDIDQLATAAASHPHLPRSTWTVRTPAQLATARAEGAQIVFEGFRPEL